jgi:hypothetical protein
MVSEPMVSTLSLDGLFKWLMKQRFQSQLLSKWTKYELRSPLGAKRIPWLCYEAQEV